MNPGQIRIVTVAAASPLTVRETAAATPAPARMISGSSYTPSIGDRVLATFTSGRWYILGGDA